MPTEAEKQAEKERVTRISGFRVTAHDVLAEVDFDALKARNDRWEAEHGKMTREERMEEELQRAMVYVGAGKAPAHIAIHVHMAHQCGASKEYLLERLKKASQWGALRGSYWSIISATNHIRRELLTNSQPSGA
jgi:hypothetical protein